MNRLRARILLILVAAAMPAIILVSVLAFRTYDVARASALDSLTRDVEVMSSRLSSIPQGAARMSALLAAATGWSDQRLDRCASNLAGVRANLPGFRTVFLFQGDNLLCTAGERKSAPEALAAYGLGDLAPGQTKTSLINLGEGPVIFAAARGSAGGSADLVAILIVDPDFLGRLLTVFRSFDSSRAYLVDRAGRNLGAHNGEPDAATEARLEHPLPEAERISFTDDARGRSYVVTSRKLANPDVWLVTTQRDVDVLADARNQLALALTAPVLTLLLVGFAVWLGLTRVVVQWVNRLTRATRSYAQGDLGARVGDASAAPVELSELAKRFDDLADRMAERSIELEGEVLQKRRYIRELHHRVKNNLQVIASLLALQKRNLPPEQKPVLRFPEDRVNAMAAAYAVSYAQTESGDVGMLAVIREVTTRLQSGVEDRHPHLRVAIAGEDQQTDLDTAIGIAMLLAELLPRFLDASAAQGPAALLEANLGPDWLTIDISLQGAAPAEQVNRLSDRFTRAYLRQLNADLETVQQNHVRLKMPAPNARLDQDLDAAPFAARRNGS